MIIITRIITNKYHTSGSEEQYEKHILSVHPEFGFTIIRNKRER